MQFTIKALLGVTLVIAMILAAMRVYDVAFVSEREESQIELGMTHQEVVVILGEPHRRSDGDREWSFVCDFPHLLSDDLHIYFDEYGKVDAITR